MQVENFGPFMTVSSTLVSSVVFENFKERKKSIFVDGNLDVNIMIIDARLQPTLETSEEDGKNTLEPSGEDHKTTLKTSVVLNHSPVSSVLSTSKNLDDWYNDLDDVLADKTTLETGGEDHNTTLQTGGKDHKTTLETGGEDATGSFVHPTATLFDELLQDETENEKLHSKRVEKIEKIHSKRVEKIGNFLRLKNSEVYTWIDPFLNNFETDRPIVEEILNHKFKNFSDDSVIFLVGGGASGSSVNTLVLSVVLEKFPKFKVIFVKGGWPSFSSSLLETGGEDGGIFLSRIAIFENVNKGTEDSKKKTITETACLYFFTLVSSEVLQIFHSFRV
jgi:hypothetical protein